MLDNLSLEGEYGCDPSIYAQIKVHLWRVNKSRIQKLANFAHTPFEQDSFLKKRSVLTHYIDELFSASLSIANDNKSAEIRVSFSVKGWLFFEFTCRDVYSIC